MPPQLTLEQRAALDAVNDLGPVTVFDPATGQDYVLIRAGGTAAAPGSVVIQTLGDQRVAVQKPFSVTIHQDGDEFCATWVEANISTGGYSIVDAVANLQSLIADAFTDVANASDSVLSKGMQKQKRVFLETLCPN